MTKKKATKKKATKKKATKKKATKKKATKKASKKKATKKKATKKKATKKKATKKKATKKKATKKKATKKKASKKKATKKKASKKKATKKKATKKKATKKKATKKKATKKASTGPSETAVEDPAISRKKRSEKWLASHGVPFITHLPPIEAEDEVTLRPPVEVAHRARLMFAIGAVGYEVEGESRWLELLKSEGTWAYATRRERAFLMGRNRTQQAMIDATWILDAVWPLLWALRAFEELGVPERGVFPREVQEFLPSVFDPGDEFFAAHQELRSIAEILDATDLVYRQHWATRPWREVQVDWLCNSAILERHKALNWLIGYGDAKTWTRSQPTPSTQSEVAKKSLP